MKEGHNHYHRDFQYRFRESQPNAQQSRESTTMQVIGPGIDSRGFAIRQLRLGYNRAIMGEMACQLPSAVV